MPRVLQLLFSAIVLAFSWVNLQLWYRLVVEAGLGATSGVSAVFPVFIWPIAVLCVFFYLTYLIWRN